MRQPPGRQHKYIANVERERERDGEKLCTDFFLLVVPLTKVKLWDYPGYIYILEDDKVIKKKQFRSGTRTPATLRIYQVCPPTVE